MYNKFVYPERESGKVNLQQVTGGTKGGLLVYRAPLFLAPELLHASQPNTSLGQVIQTIMGQNDLSVEQAALNSGVARDTLAQIVNDSLSPPVDMLGRIGQALGTEAHELLRLASPQATAVQLKSELATAIDAIFNLPTEMREEYLIALRTMLLDAKGPNLVIVGYNPVTTPSSISPSYETVKFDRLFSAKQEKSVRRALRRQGEKGIVFYEDIHKMEKQIFEQATEENSNIIARIVTDKMKELGKDTGQLASETGLSQGTVRNIANGYVSSAPSLRTGVALSKALMPRMDESSAVGKFYDEIGVDFALQETHLKVLQQPLTVQAACLSLLNDTGLATGFTAKQYATQR